MDSSPFSSCIGTSYLPTPEEAVQIKEYISEKVAHIAEVDQEIEKLNALRAKLTMDIQGHRSLLSPTHHLPIDILREIFAACLPMTHNPVVSRHEAPLLLTQVCKNWRSIVLSTPQFWSAIHIPIPSFPVDPSSHPLPVGGLSNYLTALLALIRGRMAAVHEWLERSKGSPLTISIFDGGYCPNEVCDLVLDTIIHFSPRWKHLQLDTHSCDLTRIAGLVPSQIPQLESLNVQNEVFIQNLDTTGPSLNSAPLLWSTSEIIKAPKLQAISFPRITENIVEFPLGWSQMTAISLGSDTRMSSVPAMSLKQVTFILRSCQQLVSFRLEVILCVGDPDQDRSPVRLPFLQAFSLHDSGVDVSPLFTVLELPSLKYLEFNTNARRLGHSSLEMLLPRITTLERFITEPQFFAQGHHIKCLSHMSSLTDISIRWSPFFRTPDWSPMVDDPAEQYKVVSDDLLLWFTTPDPPGEYPVPALEIFECYTTSEFTDNALVDFIKNKYSLPGIRPLKKLYIGFSRPQMLDVMEDVGEEISNQLEHDLRYPVLAASLLRGPVFFDPSAGIHPYPAAF